MIKRSAGILLPIFSLPSNYGVGTLGKEAYKFVDFLKDAKQSYWQILPIGPTQYGDSPYSTYSIYAGNPYFIDLDLLKEDGLLTNKDLKIVKNSSNTKVNYAKLSKTRNILLHTAYRNGFKKYKSSYDAFCRKNKKWLDDYALYMSLREYFKCLSWNEWPDRKIKLRDKSAIRKYSKLLEDEIKYYKFTQFLFFKQFFKLRSYMKKKKIKLIGDVPIYVPLDSSDVWVNPKCFKLTSTFVPKEVSGCPPDSFNKSGQLWGNPIYNFAYQKKNGYKWWLERIKGASEIYDVIRIDHFRGFDSFWSVKYGKPTARSGKWIKGPGMDLLGKIKTKFKNIEFIEEDLGFITDSVEKLVKDFGYPNMNVLVFGFDSREKRSYIPHSYKENSVCYTGTHDNQTLMGFYKKGKRREVNKCIKYFNIKGNFAEAVIRGGMETNSVLFIAQMQDYLGLDDKARINVPGTVNCNWFWRMKKGAYDKVLAKKIRNLTTLYGRGSNRRI